MMKDCTRVLVTNQKKYLPRADHIVILNSGKVKYKWKNTNYSNNKQFIYLFFFSLQIIRSGSFDELREHLELIKIKGGENLNVDEQLDEVEEYEEVENNDQSTVLIYIFYDKLIILLISFEAITRKIFGECRCSKLEHLQKVFFSQWKILDVFWYLYKFFLLIKCILIFISSYSWVICLCSNVRIVF